jgi:hypothetical protein
MDKLLKQVKTEWLLNLIIRENGTNC